MHFVPDLDLKMGMRKVGQRGRPDTAGGEEERQDMKRLTQQISHEFSLLQHNRRGKNVQT